MNQKIKDKLNLHPIMTYLVFIGVIIVLSGFLQLLGIGQEVYKINSTTLEYNQNLVNVKSLFNMSFKIYF